EGLIIPRRPSAAQLAGRAASCLSPGVWLHCLPDEGRASAATADENGKGGPCGRTAPLTFRARPKGRNQGTARGGKVRLSDPQQSRRVRTNDAATDARLEFTGGVQAVQWSLPG